MKIQAFYNDFLVSLANGSDVLVLVISFIIGCVIIHVLVDQQVMKREAIELHVILGFLLHFFFGVLLNFCSCLSSFT
jgi:uncharacterized membrane protein YraQ (UPF0718 family)